MASRTAFILAGGASRGAYQAGCLKRLEEEGIEPGLMVGSSIGVCNALVHASGGSEALWGFWSRAVSLPKMFDLSVTKNALIGNSLFSMDRLTGYLDEEVDYGRCFHSGTELAFVVANLTAGREELRGNRTERDVDTFRKIATAGYTIPILHPLVEIDGEHYADGGFLWNVPFEYAERWGADRIFVLSVIPSVLPPAGSLRFIPQVAMRMYDMVWRSIGNSTYLRQRVEEGTGDGARVTVLAPSPETGMFDPVGMLNAHPGKSKKLLLQGYRDTEQALLASR